MAIGTHVPHPLRPYEPLIINVALTGMVARRTDSPYVPLSVERDRRGRCAMRRAAARPCCTCTPATRMSRPPGSAARSARSCSACASAARGRILCVTTSGREVGELTKRADVLDLDGDARPDMASLTLGSMNFRTQASVNAPDVIDGLARAMAERGIRPELEVFDTGMAYLAHELLHRGRPRAAALRQPAAGRPEHRARHRRRPRRARRRAPGRHDLGGGGARRLPAQMNAIAIFAGGHVRTGLEDNLWLDARRRQPATNPQLVERVAELARIADRPIATHEQARDRLGIGGIVTLRA